MKQTLSLTLLACFAPTALSAQTLPLLTCKRLAAPICYNTGSGAVTTQPTLSPLTAYGSATWSYSPPDDGINKVAFSYEIPSLSAFIKGSNCGSPTREVSVIVSHANLYDTIYPYMAIPPSSIISNSMMSYSTANLLNKSLSSTVETLAQPYTYWTIIVREGNNSLAAQATGEAWSRSSSVCKLYVSKPYFYAPPPTFQ
jgi:hypothetical protein